jgi:hypothetical protein
MKRFGFLLLLVAVVAMLGGTALAQGDNSYYFTTYYSGSTLAGAPDATVRVINDGFTGGNLFADFYVFDDSEELTECCSCLVTPDGLLSESVAKNLTANPIHPPITGAISRGVIKVIASTNGFTASNPTIVPEAVSAGLHVWATHVQGTKVTLSAGNPVLPVVAGPFFVTETLAADSNLSGGEETMLEMLCHFDFLLSGKPCTCQPEDFDF